METDRTPCPTRLTVLFRVRLAGGEPPAMLAATVQLTTLTDMRRLAGSLLAVLAPGANEQAMRYRGVQTSIK